MISWRTILNGTGCLLLAGALEATAAPLPVSLVDPASGKSVQIQAGSEALHVVFFATWCPGCVLEIDRLTQLHARWEERGYDLVIVAVQTRQSVDRLRDFVADHPMPGRLLYDSTGEVQRALGAQNVPMHVVFDKTGVEVGRADSLGSSIERSIESLVARGRAVRGGAP